MWQPWRRKPPVIIPWWVRGPGSYRWPTPDPEPADPTRFVCYGCGRRYDPMDAELSEQHTSHAGDTGLPREALLCWLAMCQEERDELARRYESSDGPSR